MKRVTAVALSFVLTCGAFAAPPQDAGKATTAKPKSAKKSATSSVAKDLQDMKQALEAQQQQIQQLRQDVQTRDGRIQQLEQKVDQNQAAASQAQAKADSAASQAAQQDQTVSALKTDVTDLKSNATNVALSLQEEQKKVGEAIESPLALHFKGITITPGGFLAAETVWRQRALAADINSSFNSVPFPGATQSQMSEFFGSGRQSRVSMLAEGKLKDVKIGGYFEADFLSSGTTSNNNQSNSYTMRQRQVWGQAAFQSGWTVTGGQMWSLITETRKGTDIRSEALPLTIDPQYTVGFSWARQYGLRVTKNFSNKAWVGISVEDPQTTLTAHGNAANTVVGSAGNSGGTYNAFNGNYAFNKAPDLVAKLAVEPGWGHFEIFGVASQFRARIFPNATAATPSAAGAFNDSKTGGGFGVNMRGSLANKHVDVGIHLLGGNGIGRYGTGGLSEATVHDDGTLALIRSYQGLGTIEWHSPHLDLYANYGLEYAARTAFLNSAGKGVGYGSPLFANTGCSTETLPSAANGFSPGALGSCTGDTRNLQEGTVGFWYKFYNGSKGRVQFGPQYSYVVRNTWTGVGGNPKGTENMFFTSLRYYLP